MSRHKKTTTALTHKNAKSANSRNHKGQESEGSWSLIIFVLVVIGLLKLWRLSPKRVNSDGYILTKSSSGHDQLEHRKVAEEIIGRRLESWEVVHHINGLRHDNRPSNLCVMDRRDHDRYHAWYDWIKKTYGRYPRRETQLRKLRESFNGTLLDDVLNEGTGSS
jgi:hypothetical protein